MFVYAWKAGEPYRAPIFWREGQGVYTCTSSTNKTTGVGGTSLADLQPDEREN